MILRMARHRSKTYPDAGKTCSLMKGVISVEKRKFDISRCMRHAPECLRGELILYMIGSAAHEMQRHMSMSPEEWERELYEALKKKYEEP